jgi:hypothetical protein
MMRSSVLMGLTAIGALACGGRRSLRPSIVLQPCDTVSTRQGPLPGPLRVSQRPSSAAGVFVGTTSDRQTGAALDNVNVRFRGTGRFDALTDSTGVFGTIEMAPGLYTVLVTRIGYEAAHDTIRLAAGQVDTLRYRLQYRSCP